MAVDPLTFSARWPVRSYEVDRNGHVNNSVYLSWAEELANRHAELAGYGREWCAARQGAWVVHHSEITHHRPAGYGDEVALTVRVELVSGVRGVRRTWIRRHPGGELLAEVLTEWAWTRLRDGRPAPVPPELVEVAAPHTRAFLASPAGPGLRARARGESRER
ncbi:MAG: acyl-CoA thioesterase [Candidatus Dormibacterales bacterium]